METLTMHPKNKEQLIALKAIAKALNVPFEKNKVNELTEREKALKLYGIELVETIEKGREDAKSGRVTTVKIEDLQSFLGL